MNRQIKDTGSLRGRLIVQLLLSAAILALVLNFTVRYIAKQTAEGTQDSILGASVISIIDEIKIKNGKIVVDIPYSALSMLGSISDDRVFYRIDLDDKILTGYKDLQHHPETHSQSYPVYRSKVFRGSQMRLATGLRQVFYGGKNHNVRVTIAQTRNAQDRVAQQITNTAAAFAIGFFILAGILSWAAASNALRPLARLEQSVRRRGPQDLRPIKAKAPREIVPLLLALNSFMDRLRLALGRTEDFISQAAHRVRTPLATVRANAEIVLHGTKDKAQREALRTMIRAVDESSRSASQLLDHAMVSFRSDQISFEPLRFSNLVSQVVDDLSPTSELRDISIIWQPSLPCKIRGDKIMLIGALRNLLDNAIKYSPRESVINITLATQNNLCCLQICDQGRGLAGECQEAIKKRFKRGKNADDVIGSGLGLTIADEVANSHAGSLSLQSNKGQGTCVSFCLPTQS